MRHSRSTILVLGLLLAGGAMAEPTYAQIPTEFHNLQVLPEDITRSQLLGYMRGFSFATGLRCSGCHMGEEGQPFSEYDFPSDDRPTKRKAREMLKMVQAINDQHLANLPERSEPNVQVTCATCHGGIQRPVAIETEVAQVIETDGTEAAAAHYRELRDIYHGSRAYDFTEQPLIELAQTVARGGDPAAGLAMLELNLEFHPNSGQTYTVLGELQARTGDNESAIASFQKALEIDPDNQFAQRRLQELQGG